jgi:hypothetical protein
MNRMLRAVLVVAPLLIALGCGGGNSTEESAARGLELSSRDSAAAIVCGHEDPCPKGTICVSGTRCAVICRNDGDCPSGQTCSGKFGGRRFCAQ